MYYSYSQEYKEKLRKELKLNSHLSDKTFISKVGVLLDYYGADYKGYSAITTHSREVISSLKHAERLWLLSKEAETEELAWKAKALSLLMCDVLINLLLKSKLSALDLIAENLVASVEPALKSKDAELEKKHLDELEGILLRKEEYKESAKKLFSSQPVQYSELTDILSMVARLVSGFDLVVLPYSRVNEQSNKFGVVFVPDNVDYRLSKDENEKIMVGLVILSSIKYKSDPRNLHKWKGGGLGVVLTYVNHEELEEFRKLSMLLEKKLKVGSDESS